MTEHIGGPETSDAIRARHERYLASDESSGGLFAVTVGPERVAAGWVGYWQATWRGEAVWECGWSILPKFQGQGVATAASALMLAHAAARDGHRYMHAFPAVGNPASNALCARLGFVCLGEVKVEYPKGSMMRSNGWRFDLHARV